MNPVFCEKSGRSWVPEPWTRFSISPPDTGKVQEEPSQQISRRNKVLAKMKQVQLLQLSKHLSVSCLWYSRVVSATPIKTVTTIHNTCPIIADLRMFRLVCGSSLSFSFDSEILARCNRTLYFPQTFSTLVQSCSSNLAQSKSLSLYTQAWSDQGRI